MALSIAVQMDSLKTVRVGFDSTFAMMEEAQKRGHSLFCYQPQDLVLKNHRLFARGINVKVHRERSDPFEEVSSEKKPLSHVDVLLIRQDPPFDMAYLTTTYLLEHLKEDVLVINHPRAVRNYPEKLLVTHFSQHTPPTLITRNLESIQAFRAQYGHVMFKPIYGNGGAGIFKVLDGDENFFALLEWFLKISSEPLIVQQYLPDVSQGDKRILLVEGEPVGAFNRLAAKGESRSNMHVGGRPVPCEITPSERDMCAHIGPFLRQEGILFAGIDVIGGFLTEINITSPTGIEEVRRFGGANVAALFWDAVEKRLEDLKKPL